MIASTTLLISKARLRVSRLSVGLVHAVSPSQTDEQEVINFLLTTEIIPLCLRIMEYGTELSKTVATFILQKILLDETGKPDVKKTTVSGISSNVY